MFLLADQPDYEPARDQNLVSLARRANRDPLEFVYDALLEDEGRSFLYLPALNFAAGNLDAVREMLLDERTIPGLGDGGAHVGTICDGSFPTTLLTHWCRDRDGERLTAPFVVKAQCHDTAIAVGLADRGVVAPGYKADLNVIDFDGLRLASPEMHFDLPAGGRRLLQRADGYLHTIVSGREVYENGTPTGESPGQLVRGAQLAPIS
jgi:N-acyl-D-aspartate/D-glutamate deacylase